MQPLSGRTSTALGQKGGLRDGSDRPFSRGTDRQTARAVRCFGQSAPLHPHSRKRRRLPPGGTAPERHRHGKRAGRQGLSLPPGLTRWTARPSSTQSKPAAPKLSYRQKPTASSNVVATSRAIASAISSSVSSTKSNTIVLSQHDMQSAPETPWPSSPLYPPSSRSSACQQNLGNSSMNEHLNS